MRHSTSPVVAPDYPIAALIDFFETLSLDKVEHIGDIYAADARFKDPFNEVRGIAAIKQLFAHMFVQVKEPRFVILSSTAQDEQLFLTWDFRFYMPRFATEEQCIHGATHFRFDAEGKVCVHRDYWDAAEELYEKLPLLGSLMRVLKRVARK
ncbi:nuclear transport factor 2 family protein [Herbaspirillum sp. RTI4]|uniref:nuclear transport factor 2 family protein n=1 Tax=Herbaspirillum sp. RTI4 TaxID=3048640 RepID=UPI002AB3B656|nr:nuclear transport factor 2 family protein [Herbaspirillum sp. RTI4]MDY7579484.1 nuclear transport factor 2 family protein [Herbaspirillum sp. RTI4]MEA9980398.1 nuclear transport factor 2 family protein [Herbaspirillum sp. RTI4]